MTLDELKQEGFYQQLSEGQQKFVMARCGGAEKKEAAKIAWSCTTDASATTMAHKAMKNANVKWLINSFLGTGAANRVPSAEELAAWNWEQATRAGMDPALSIKFAANVSKIMGYETRPGEAPPKPPADDGDEEFSD